MKTLIIALLVASFSIAHAETISGNEITVIDGDTPNPTLEIIIVSTSFIVRSAPQRIADPHWSARLTTSLKSAMTAYTNWRTERAAVAVLSSMSELMLKDIGLSRCEISSAVRRVRLLSPDDIVGAAERDGGAAS
jgi:uncharacterized protein YjiS (DUF1127 family)